MKKMILLAAVLGILTSCGKDLAEVNYLPGKWNLVQSELYENDTLQAVSASDEINTVYYFFSCEDANGTSCEMYIEEDGEQQYYDYVFDKRNQMLLVNETSVFEVAQLNSTQLTLVREYDQYRSAYLFEKSE